MATQNPIFADLHLIPELLRALEHSGYERPTEIQALAIPPALDGADMFACAQTGTGKTAAFTLPILQKLQSDLKFVAAGEFRALILAPTRELVEQICENARAYAKFLDLKCLKIYGGVSQNQQIKALEGGVDLLVATPGRLIDIFRQKKLSFKAVKYFVLDEADRMLDMGFIRDIRLICRELPADRQSMLFSATLGREVQSLASFVVKNPVKISVNPQSPTVEKISQKLFFVAKEDKIPILKQIILDKFASSPDAIALVFCRTKRGASRVARQLAGEEFKAALIHGDKSQSARKSALQSFKDRISRVLVATDVAARGIDVKSMPLVVNFDLPEEPETYIHRIGRTARAEAEGEAISLCSPGEVPLVRAIEKLIRRDIPRVDGGKYHCQTAEDLKDSDKNLSYRKVLDEPNQIQTHKDSPKASDASSRANERAKESAAEPQKTQLEPSCAERGEKSRQDSKGELKKGGKTPQKSATLAPSSGGLGGNLPVKSALKPDFKSRKKSSNRKNFDGEGDSKPPKNFASAVQKFKACGRAQYQSSKQSKTGARTKQRNSESAKFSSLLTRDNKSNNFHSTKSNPAKFQIPWMVRKRILKAKGKKF